MKKIAIVLGLVIAASAPAHAINHAFRAKLERSGCTQVTEANGTCDVNKTKAQNTKRQHPTTKLDKAASEAQSVIGAAISEGATFLIEQGWKANNGEWHKDGHILHLLVEDGMITNAQLVK